MDDATAPAPTVEDRTAAPRLVALEQLLDACEQTSSLDEGQWSALTGFVVDAALTNDDATLETAYNGLQWLSDQLEDDAEQDAGVAFQHGRARGVLDVLRWQLRRSVSATAPTLPRHGLAARVLQFVTQYPGSRNQAIASELDVDETQISRVGRVLRGSVLVSVCRVGRENAWYVTPKGQACLQAMGMDADIRADNLASGQRPRDADSRDTSEQQPVPAGSEYGDTQSRTLSEDVGKVLTSILVNEPRTADLVQETTGLPQTSVAEAIEFLLTHGYVVKDPDRSGAPSLLRVNDDRHRAIGVSIRKGEITGALVNLRARTVRHATVTVDVTDVPRLVDKVAWVCQELMRDEAVDPGDVVGLGVNLPGHIDSRLGRVVYTPLSRSSQWTGLQLGSALSTAMKLPTTVENDVNALALYEMYFGDGQGQTDFAVVFVTSEGEGVGSGLVIDGSLVHGSSGSAGEIGHAPIGDLSRLCRCGNHGCLEATVGFSGMRDKFLRAGLTVPSTLPDASALVAGGDHFAREVFAQAGEAFGLGVVTILNTLDPGLLILSGPTEIIDVGNQVASATAFTTAAQRTLKNHAFSTSRTHTRVQNKLLTGVYAAQGAASALLLQRVYEPTLNVPRAAAAAAPTPRPAVVRVPDAAIS